MSRGLNRKRHAKDIGWRPIIANPDGSREERRAARKLHVDDLPEASDDAAAEIMRERVKFESRRRLRSRR